MLSKCSPPITVRWHSSQSTGSPKCHTRQSDDGQSSTKYQMNFIKHVKSFSVMPTHTPPNHIKALVTVMVYGPKSIRNMKDATVVTVITEAQHWNGIPFLLTLVWMSLDRSLTDVCWQFSSVRPSTPFSADTDTPIFCCQPILIPFKSGSGAAWLTDQELQTPPLQLIAVVAESTGCSAAADAFDLSFQYLLSSFCHATSWRCIICTWLW